MLPRIKSQTVEYTRRYPEKISFHAFTVLPLGITLQVKGDDYEAFRRPSTSQEPLHWILLVSRFSDFPDLDRILNSMYINFQVLRRLGAITGLEYSVLNAYVKAGSVESSILQARGTCHDYPAWFQTVTDLDTFVGLHEKATIVFLEVDSFCSNFFYVTQWARAIGNDERLRNISLHFGRTFRDYDNQSATVTLYELSLVDRAINSSVTIACVIELYCHCGSSESAAGKIASM